jgi:hypothetical protein
MKQFYFLMAFVAFSLFSFGQKHTGLTAVASDVTNSTVPMFDANMGTRWQDASNTDNASFVVDLGEVKNVNSIKIYWEGANAKAYNISFSTDNNSFTGELVYTNKAAGTRTDLISGLNNDCRYIKFQGVTRQLPYGYSIWEFEVYPAVAAALTSLVVTPTTQSILLGATKQFSVSGLDQIGNPFALTNATVWSVDGTGASIDATGLFSSTSKGFYTVTATNSTLTKSTTIDVLPTNSNLSVVAGVSATATTSNFIAANNAALAFDNNAGTRWETVAGVDPQWIMVDLGGKKAITDIAITWEGASAKDYIIEGSVNGTDWTTQLTKTALPNGARTDRWYDVNFDAQYVRLTGTARTSVYGYSIWEFKIFGTVATTTTYPPITGNKSISVYPNPTTSLLNFTSEVSKASLYSLQGQLVLENNKVSKLNLSSLGKGFYILRLVNNSGEKQSLKVELR